MDDEGTVVGAAEADDVGGAAAAAAVADAVLPLASKCTRAPFGLVGLRPSVSPDPHEYTPPKSSRTTDELLPAKHL